MVETIGNVIPTEVPVDSSVVGDKTIKVLLIVIGILCYLFSRQNTVPLEIGKAGNQYVAKISKQPVPAER